VIGEAPAWFLRDRDRTSLIITELAPLRSPRTVPSPGGERTSRALGCSAKCSARTSSKSAISLEKRARSWMAEGDRPGPWAVLEVLEAQNAARISSERRSMLRVALNTEAEVNFR
jgi:hypothetical protein